MPADHPLKEKEGGSQSTPGEYIDWLLDVVEACDRVLAPHGSLCFELGDTYSGSGGGGGDYLEGGWREGQQQFAGSNASMRESNAAHWRQKNRKVESREHRPEREGTGADGGSRVVPVSGGTGWALPKSLSLIPESFRFAMVYGFNPFTGRQTERWRLRNVVRHFRPNPPVGALGDKVRPATSEWAVLTKSPRRYFDLDSVRSDAPRATNGTPLRRPAIGKEFSGTLHTDNGSSVARWWCDFRQAQVAVIPTVAGLANDFEVVDLIGVKVGVEQAERSYVVDLEPDVLNSTPSAAVAIAVERSLPGFLPIGSAVADDSPSPCGVVLASPVGRTPDAVALKVAEVVAVEGRLVSLDRLVARVTLDIKGTLCAALFSVPVSPLQPANSSGAPPLDWFTEDDLEWKDGAGFIEPMGGYPGAHYATFSPRAITRFIKAMCPEQVCRTCGEARRRIVEKSERYLEARALLSVRAGSAWDENSGNRADGLPSGAARAKLADGSEFTAAEYTTVGFTDCGHNDFRAGVVLDCFAGSGTTGAVASGHGRDSILVDLDERNWNLALERVGPLVLQRGEVAA